MSKEPTILVRGKAFHRRVQQDWRIEAEGDIHPERTIPLVSSGTFRRKRHGRLDLFVDDVGGCVVVVEIKSTNWDKILHRNRRRLLASHRRQVWRYIDAYLGRGRLDVVPGIIYPHAPVDKAVCTEIVDYLNDYGIQVVWYDDLPEENESSE